MTILKYKNYKGTSAFDAECGTFHGKILSIKDLETYEAESLETLQKEFEISVDDYIDTCYQIGKPIP
jgi:predicted HicB family RNase H-like nuclease